MIREAVWQLSPLQETLAMLSAQPAGHSSKGMPWTLSMRAAMWPHLPNSMHRHAAAAAALRVMLLKGTS
jgi:hypothetical protein